jgi:hypothetical protein
VVAVAVAIDHQLAIEAMSNSRHLDPVTANELRKQKQPAKYQPIIVVAIPRVLMHQLRHTGHDC